MEGEYPFIPRYTFWYYNKQKKCLTVDIEAYTRAGAEKKLRDMEKDNCKYIIRVDRWSMQDVLNVGYRADIA